MKLANHVCIMTCVAMIAMAAQAADPENPLIDYQAFSQQVLTVGELRQSRRISEDDFIRMSKDPGTIVLDARSKEKYDLLHVKGAKHLSLPDMTDEELAKVIPTKNTRVLIYCNNNFTNAEVAFPSKRPAAALNVHTFNVLHSYGYTNIYELKPLLDRNTSKIAFEGTKVQLERLSQAQQPTRGQL